MYQKDKIYNGIMEFSFEELRASRYWKRRGEREERKREGLLSVKFSNSQLAEV